MLLRNKHACMLNQVTKAPLGLKIKQLKSIHFYLYNRNVIKTQHR